MRASALVIGLCGCNGVFGLANTTPGDAPVPPDQVGCSGETFQGPIALPLPGPLSYSDPSMRVDGLELWLSASVNSEVRLFVTTRANTNDNFGTPVMPPFATNTQELCPSITKDGLRLAYISARNGSTQAWEVTRATTGDAFANPTVMLGLEQLSMDSIAISVDGLSLYYNLPSQTTIYVAKRPALGAAFGKGTLVATGGTDAEPSPDELELFIYDRGIDSVVRQRRASTTVPFDPATDLIAGSARFPAITADSKTLLLVTNTGIGVMTRNCP